MANRKTKKFFSPVVGIIALAVAALGTVIIVAAVSAVMNGEKVKGKAFLLGGGLALGGVAAFIYGAFKDGCIRCKKKFSKAKSSFAAALYPQVAAVAESANAEQIRGLIGSPSFDPRHRTDFDVEYCAGCREVGTVRVVEMRDNGQYDEFLRGTKHIPLEAEAVAACLAVVESRKP